MARRIKPVPEIAHNLFSYEPDTGVILSKRTGKKAGCLRPTGYTTLTINGGHFFAHRVAWFLYHGENPDGILDHINRDKTDNRIANLRCVTERENVLNRSGVRGIGFYWSHGGKYLNVQAHYAGKLVYAGKSVFMAHFHRRMAVVADLPIGIEHHTCVPLFWASALKVKYGI